MPQTLDEEIVVNRAKKRYPELNFDKFIYISAKTKAIVTCKKHGDFSIDPDKLLSSPHGCQKCGRELQVRTKAKRKYLGKSQEWFLEKAKSVHGYRYDYSETKYVGSKTKVTIICKKHGQFSTTPSNHLYGFNCSKCGDDVLRLTTEEFTKRAIKAHGDRYDYSVSNYISTDAHIEIICKKHGRFLQKPTLHLQGKGCQKCRKSKNEAKIENFFNRNKLNFDIQKTFDTCRNPATNCKLRFDFFLPDYNLLIEYDGRQHFHACSIWNEFYGDGEKKLKERQRFDGIKTEWAAENNVELFRISYRHRRTIEKRIKQFFFEKYSIDLEL